VNRSDRIDVGVDPRPGIMHRSTGLGPPVLLLPPVLPAVGLPAEAVFGALLERLAEDFRCTLVDLPERWHHDLACGDRAAARDLACILHSAMEASGTEGYSVIALGGTFDVVDALLTCSDDAITHVVLGGCCVSPSRMPRGEAGATTASATMESEVEVRLRDGGLLGHDERWVGEVLGSLVHDRGRLLPALVAAATAPGGTDTYEAFHAPAGTSPEPVGASRSRHTHRRATLSVWGRFDRYAPLERGMAAMSDTVTGEMVVLNECGHLGPVECPDRYASHVRSFLQAPPARPKGP